MDKSYETRQGSSQEGSSIVETKLATLNEAIELIEFKLTPDGQEALLAIDEPEDPAALREELLLLQGEKAHVVEHLRHVGRIIARFEVEHTSQNQPLA